MLSEQAKLMYAFNNITKRIWNECVTHEEATHKHTKDEEVNRKMAK